MSTLRTISAGFALAIFAAMPAAVHATASPEAIAVLDQEQRWVHAIATHDTKTLDSILADNFVHINFQGKLFYREDVLKNVKRLRPYVEKTGEQTVDFAGDVAIVHGVNTIMQQGKVLIRLRYTDVYQKQRGTWRALSAQETAIAAQ